MPPAAMLSHARTRVADRSIQFCLKSAKSDAPDVPASTNVVAPALKECASGTSDCCQVGPPSPLCGYTWTCMSIRPGATYRPATSTDCRDGLSIAGATRAMRPSCTATSMTPSRLFAGSITCPLRSTTSYSTSPAALDMSTARTPPRRDYDAGAHALEIQTTCPRFGL